MLPLLTSCTVNPSHSGASPPEVLGQAAAYCCYRPGLGTSADGELTALMFAVIPRDWRYCSCGESLLL